MNPHTPSASQRIQYGLHVLRTTVSEKTKKILVQLGNAIGKTADSDNNEWVQHVGFVSLAPKAEAGKRAAYTVVIRQGNRDIVIGSQDLRGLELAGQMEDGDTCIYAPGPDGKGQARTIYKGNGSIHHYTRVGNSEDGKGITVQLDAEGNAVRILNGAGFGIIVDEDGIVLTAKDSSLKLGADGTAKLVGKGQAQVDGSSIIIGSQGVPGVNSAIMGPAGLAGVPNPKIILGT